MGDQLVNSPCREEVIFTFAASETLTLSAHGGTHLDAPWRYQPTMNSGKGAITIDEVPLDGCVRPGVRLD